MKNPFLNYRNRAYLHFVVCFVDEGTSRTLHFAVGSDMFKFMRMIHDTFDTDSSPADISFVGYVPNHNEIREFFQLI